MKQITITNKKRSLLSRFVAVAFLLIACNANLQAQVSAYSFGAAVGAYGIAVAPGAGAVGGAAILDDQSYTTSSIPFAFTYNGVSYPAASILGFNANGFIRIGAAPGNSYAVLSSTLANTMQTVAAFNRDLQENQYPTTTATRTAGSTTLTVASAANFAIGMKLNDGTGLAAAGIPAGTIVTAIAGTTITMSQAATTSGSGAVAPAGALTIWNFGTAPNRSFIFQYVNYRRYFATAGQDNYNFQIWLNEGGGVAANQTVQVRFGTCSSTSGTAISPMVGLKGNSNADFNNRTMGTWAASIAGTTNAATMSHSNTSFPTAGTTWTWTPPNLCTGTPNAGTATISTVSGCPSVNFNLSATGLSNGTGLTYQWQSAPTTAGPWGNVTGGTTVNFTTNTAVNQCYRLRTTCTASGLSNTSATVCYTVTTGLCGCGAYPASNATSAADEDISNVTVGTMNNSSNCSVIAPGAGSILNQYSNFTGIAGPSVQQGNNVSFSLTQTSCGGPYANFFQLYVDWNQNGTFELTEQMYSQPTSVTGNQTVTGSFTVPPTAAIGTTRMRVVNVEAAASATTNYAITTFLWGETEDYCFTVTAPAPCVGTPNPGNTLSTNSLVCIGDPFTLSFQTPQSGAGLTFQWQSGTSAVGPWTDIIGATSNTWLVSSQSVTTWYRCNIACSGTPGPSNPIQIVQKAPTQCYCVPAVTFGCTDGDVIARVQLNTLDNNSGTGCPSGTAGYSDYTTNPALTTTLSAATTYGLTVFAGQYAQGYAAWIDYNDDGVFNNVTERVGNTVANVNGSGLVGVLGSSATFPITLSCNPPVGQHRLRVRCIFATAGSSITPCNTATWGEIEDYLITIAAPPVCPQGGLLTATSTGSTANLSWPQNCSVATNYDFEYGPVGFTLGTGTILSNQAVTINAGNGSFSIPGLPLGDYQVYYRANCGGGNFSPWSLPASFTIGYCPVTTSLGGYGLTSFTTTLGTTNINQTSGYGVAPSGFSNYTATQIVTQYAGGAINFTSNDGGQANVLHIWVDWNGDLDFVDAGEKVFTNHTYTSINNGTINVPIATVPGMKRMRVRCDYSTTYDQQPCGNMPSGETEDYGFMVTPTPTCFPPTALVATSIFPGTTANISWTAPTQGNAPVFYEYAVTTSPTPPVTPGTQVNTTSVTGVPTVPSVINYLHVRTDCNGLGTDYSIWVTFAFQAGYCNSTATVSNVNFISNVTTLQAFVNINNNSTNTAGGYQDFTAGPSISAYAGTTFGFTAALQAPVPVGFNVWIDWNQDLDFVDAGENVLTSTGFQYTGVPFPFQNTITVPAGTPAGNYRMRCKVTNNPITMPACGNIAQGETEDYTVNIIPIPNCSAAVFASTYTTSTNLPLVCTGQSILLNLSPVPPVATNLSYELQFSTSPGGPWTTQQTQSTTFFVVPTPSSGYYRIRILCSGTAIGATTWTPAEISISDPAITSAFGVTQCGPGSVALSASNTPAASTVKWYAGPVGGAPIATGNTYNTPVLTTSTTYYVQAENVIPTADIGTNPGGTTVNNCTPFTSFWESSRSFYLVSKNELLAAGLQAGQLTSLGFDVTSTGGFGQTNFKISIAHTAAANLDAGMTTANTGFTDVFTTPNEPAPSLGWRVFNFSTPFSWNGNDNIIVAVCHDGAGGGYGTNSGIRITQTPFNSVCGIYNDGINLCGATTGLNTTAPNKLRPNMRFGGAISACNSPRVPVNVTIYDNPQLTVPANALFAPTVATFNPIPVTASSSTSGATVTYTANPGLYVDAVTSALAVPGTDVDGTTLYAAPLTTTNYTVSATSIDGCIVTGNYTITVDASGIPNSVCGGSLYPVSNSIIYTVINTLGANAGLNFPCGPLGNQTWLKAIVPASGEIHVTTRKNGASLTDVTATQVAIFYTPGSNTCNPIPNNQACNTNGGADQFSYANYYGMTPGDTCYIRLAGVGTTAVPNGRFKVCVTSHLIWTGALNDDFNVSSNWQDGDATSITVPDATRSGLFPAGTVQPKLYANSTIRGVNLQAAPPFYGSPGINLNGFTLNVKGNWNVGPAANASTVLACNGLVEFNGTGATPQLITGRTTFGNLNTNNNVGGVQANAPTGVSCVLTPVAGTFNSNGNLILKSTTANSAALVNPSAGSITGNVTVERKIGTTSGYHYLSAAVSGAFVNNTVNGWRDDFTILSTLDGQIFIPGDVYTSLATVWEYNETNPNPNPDYGWIGATGTTDAITPLKGFACVVPANVTVDVVGPLNNNAIGGGYTITKQTDGTNLIGNPYPSPISWNSFRGLASNTSALSTSGYKAFITTGGYAGAYGTWNGSVGSPATVTDKIASSQGFIVTCNQPTATINALNSVRLVTAADVNGQFFGYNSVPDLMRIEVQGNGFANETAIYFDASSTDAYNNSHDSKTLFAPTPGLPTIYSTVENTKLAINVMGNLNANKVVPMGVKIQTAGTYNIVATDMTSFAPSVIAYLEDTQAGTMTNLRTNPSYSVTLAEGEINDRFYIHFHPAVELNAVNETCAGNDGKLVINYPTTNTVNIVVKDANGNVVAAQNNVTGVVTVNNLVAGNYVAEMTFGVAPNTYTATDYFTVAGGNAVFANLSASANTVDMAANTTVQFTATAQGATGFNWNFGDGTIIINGPANVSHTFAQAGTYNVTFEASNGICNAVATTTVEVTNATGLTAIASSNLQVVGVGSRVTVRFGSKMEGTGNIEVINMLGEVVAHLDNVAMKGTREIDMTNIAAGQYLVRITNNNSLFTEKVYLSRQ